LSALEGFWRLVLKWFTAHRVKGQADYGKPQQHVPIAIFQNRRAICSAATPGGI
jgi:hypothetical protein